MCKSVGNLCGRSFVIVTKIIHFFFDSKSLLLGIYPIAIYCSIICRDEIGDSLNVSTELCELHATISGKMFFKIHIWLCIEHLWKDMQEMDNSGSF